MNAAVGRAVALGGGHGQARTLAALRTVAEHVTAVATVADDGGSSGRLRRELGVLPPGDLRMAVAALGDDTLWRRLLDHRFDAGGLEGHSLGNLVMVGLAQLEGGLVEGLEALTRLVGTHHTVLPSTLADVHLAGTGPDGDVVGQAAIARASGIRDLRLVGEDPAACGAAVEAIDAADLVVLGPGSVLTSVVPNLLVPGIAAAVARTRAPVVFVANLDEQPGEGEGWSIADHVRLLGTVVDGLRLDHVLVHDGPVPASDRPVLRADDELRMLVADVHSWDLLSRGPTGGHDPAAVADVLRFLLA